MAFTKSGPQYCFTQCFKKKNPYYLSSVYKFLKETREYKCFFRVLNNSLEYVS